MAEHHSTEVLAERIKVNAVHIDEIKADMRTDHSKCEVCASTLRADIAAIKASIADLRVTSAVTAVKVSAVISGAAILLSTLIPHIFKMFTT